VIELADRLEGLSPAKRELLLRQLKKMKGGEVSRPAVRPRGAGSGADFQLSYAQQRLWFLDQLEPGNPFYNLPGAVRLQGQLAEARLERALSGVVARHEALRTIFPSIEGRPVQRVAPPALFSLPVIDLSALPEERRRRAARALALAVGRRPFDLAAGPLLRGLLLRLGSAERILAFAVHHIVSDGWSMRILVRELTALYQGSPLPELAVQYADYAVAERQWLDGEALAPQLGYWRRQLAGLPGLLELPADRPRPEVQTFRGGRQHFAFPADTVAALRDLGQAEKATPFMTMLAGFTALLHRYGGREDIPVGTPIANRDRVETEGLIGFFVNTLVLRCDLSGDPDFRQLLARVRETTLQAFAHPDLPFERLVEELQPDRDLAHTPLFQVLFAFQSLRAEGQAASDLRLEHLAVETGKSLFDLTINLEETPARIAGSFEYNLDLFDPVRMRRMAAHLETLLGGIAGDPRRRLSDLPLLSEAERHQALSEWSDSAAAYPRQARVHELIAAQAARTPEAVAVSCGDRRLTYRELDERAGRLAARLARLGVGFESRVGVCLERSPEMLIALLGVWKAGAAYVPMDPFYPEERLAWMREDGGLTLLLTDVESGEDGLLPVSGGPETLAYVIYTSGSTGRPKGVEVSHGALVSFLESMRGKPGLGADDVLLAVTSLSFDIAGLELFLPLLVGARVELADRETAGDGRRLLDLLRASGATVMQATPVTWHMLIEAGWHGGEGLVVLCGGEALPDRLAAGLCERSDAVWNLYGPTETTVWSAARRVRPGERVAIGPPIANTGLYLLDARLRPVPLGIPGELWIGGDGLARGYRNRPDLTAERFLPDPFAERPGARLYRTGDLARFRADGAIEFLGRADHQVKVRGHRIELGEIEVALESHEAVERAVVMAAPDGLSLAAWVLPRGSASPAELRGYLQGRLPEYMIPSAFVALESFPLTPNGKIDRRALAANRPRPAAAPTERVAPRSPAEELLAGIWERVLGVEGIGAHDNFFALGGHSLLATQMISRVRDAFAAELPLRALFEAPTVAGLAARIEAARSEPGAAAPPLVRVPRDGRLPLSFGQQRLWFLDQLEPGSAAYNMPAAVRLEGELDPAALAGALSEVVRRHEVLRTVFRLPGGEEEPVQVILPAGGVPLPLVDLSGLPRVARQAEAHRRATAEARRPFVLSRGPLLRAALLRMDGPEGVRGSEHVLLLAVHHIVNDGVSTGLLLRELAALYGALGQGRPSPLADLPVQYADYAAWQRHWLNGGVLEAQIAYWRQALAGIPPLLDLPTDRPRPGIQTFRGALRRTIFPAALADEVRRLGRSLGLTPFMVLLAAFQTLLHRVSGQDRLAVGSPAANRSRMELEGLIGFFVNTLVLAGDLSGEPGFQELLTRTREAALGAFAHQDLPFEKLVEELAPERNLAHAPLFQVLFTFQSAAAPAAEPLPAGGLVISPVAAEMGAAKFELTLEIEDRGRGFAAALEFNTDLFDAATAGRLLEQLCDLLAAAVARPESRVSELPLLGEVQRAQLLVEWNDTASGESPAACLHILIAAQARLAPDAPAVIAPEGTLTRADLADRAGRLAAHLRTLGVGPEVLVGICMERSLDMIVGILGVLGAGGAYLPLDPAYPKERLDFMLADAGAPVVLTQERLLERLSGPGPRWIPLDRDWAAISATAASPPAPPMALDPGHLAYVIYTSGSTGRPKGVAIEHGAAVALLRWASEVYPAADRAGVLASTSVCFDLSVFEIFLPLCHGGSLILAENALHLPHLPAAGGVTLVNTVPSAIAELVRGGSLPASVRTVVLAGEPLPRRLADEIYGVGTVERVYNCYGPSEDATYSTFALIERQGGPPPIGRPIGGGQAYVLDARFQPAPAGVPGELCLGGAGLARVYLNRPELTAERFVPDPFSGRPGARLYRTGDLVRQQADGVLMFLGRIDHQVKIRGFRIELGEIEATLRRHPGVAEAVVLARGGGEPGDLRLTAYVVGRQGEAPPVEELRGFLRSKLPVHMVPWAFVPLPALPLNANGKIDRKALPDPERGAWGAPAEMEEPRSDMERLIADAWRDLLRLDRVGIDDNFFDSGGHSLLAVRVYHRLKGALGREFPLVAMFEYPTIRALARYLEAGEAAPASRQRGQDRGARRREAARSRNRSRTSGA